MKQLFEWIKASERLPEKAGLYHFRTTGGLQDIVFYNEKHGFFKVKSIRKETENKYKPELDMEFIPLKYKIEDMEYLSPASPLPISGDEGKPLKIEKLKAERNDYLAVLRGGQSGKYPSLNQAFQEEIEEVLKKYNKL
jgi:hypothetical protein